MNMGNTVKDEIYFLQYSPYFVFVSQGVNKQLCKLHYTKIQTAYVKVD